MTTITLPRATVEQALHVAVCAGYPLALIKALRAALEQQAEPVEPVAWLIWLHGPAGHFDHKQFAEMEFERRNKEYPDPDRKLLPLYTAPPQRKPLTSDKDRPDQGATYVEGYGYVDTRAVRAVERAHGIGEGS